MPQQILDQNIVTPLYQQLKEVLAAAVESGEYGYGTCIPSESELSEKYKISRITVRKAITELVKEGVLEKHQGKGTFVEKPKLERKIIEFVSFSTACAYNGMRPGSKVIKREIREPDESERRELLIEPGDHVIHIQRLRYADGDLLLLENNYFSYKPFSYLMQSDLETKSLYEVLKEHGVRLSSAKKTLELSLATFAIASQLNIRPNSPLFRLKGIVYDDASRPVHLSLQFIRGDRYKFVF